LVKSPPTRPADYYDDFADRQVRGGINARHLAIDRWLARFGLQPGLDVLEIGCGVGTQTELIAKRLAGSGSVTAVDLSPRSIELARSRLADWSNVRLIADDVVGLDLDEVFDVVVMPDVIEHIPISQHLKLFANVRRWLRESGWALVHMPNPFYLEWCRRNRPELLQVIDQAIYTETLIANTQSNDLYVHYLETYPIWVAECDYQIIVLRPMPRDVQFATPLEPDQSLRAKVARASRRILRSKD
jgi:cyclopropane fatty-acyl-phospholipid synthase-like methyltransferase